MTDKASGQTLDASPTLLQTWTEESEAQHLKDLTEQAVTLSIASEKKRNEWLTNVAGYSTISKALDLGREEDFQAWLTAAESSQKEKYEAWCDAAEKSLSAQIAVYDATDTSWLRRHILEVDEALAREYIGNTLYDQFVKIAKDHTIDTNLQKEA